MSWWLNKLTNFTSNSDPHQEAPIDGEGKEDSLSTALDRLTEHFLKRISKIRINSWSDFERRPYGCVFPVISFLILRSHQWTSFRDFVIKALGCCFFPIPCFCIAHLWPKRSPFVRRKSKNAVLLVNSNFGKYSWEKGVMCPPLNKFLVQFLLAHEFQKWSLTQTQVFSHFHTFNRTQ